MSRPISVVIHMHALRQNLERVKEAARGRELWAVVKANAYGHGIENAVRAFEEADGLAVIEVLEAERARAAGWRKKILLLEGFFDEDDVKKIDRLGVETVVHSYWQIDLLKKLAPFKNIKVHVKINSGMNRLGFLPSEARKVMDQLNRIAGVATAGVVTHFANAEPTYVAEGPATVAKQLARLGRFQDLEGVCLANSAATFFRSEVGGSAVRVGVALYGASPDPHIGNTELRIEPAMTFSAAVIALRDIAAGESVGYGSRWSAKRNARIAVVACGYADGYPRTMPDGAPVWVEGSFAPLAGSVSMDMLTIDVTDVPAVRIGSKVELWGSHVLVNDLAARCGTIGYELLCALASRVPVSVD